MLDIPYGNYMQIVLSLPPEVDTSGAYKNVVLKLYYKTCVLDTKNTIKMVETIVRNGKEKCVRKETCHQ